MHTFRLKPHLIQLFTRKMSTDTFKGIPLSEIYGGRDPFSLDHLPPVVNKREHTVLYKLPVDVNAGRPPDAFNGENKWDQNHVRLPCAPQNEYKTECAVCHSDKKQTI